MSQTHITDLSNVDYNHKLNVNNNNNNDICESAYYLPEELTDKMKETRIFCCAHKLKKLTGKS